MILHAYKDVISDMEVTDVRRKISDETEGDEEATYTSEEMQERVKEGYFIRDSERNLVCCSNEEIFKAEMCKEKW